MLTREDNETLCRVGRGTPMGELMRRYWLPVRPVEWFGDAGGDPRRLRLLGDDLIAFRDSRGEIAIMDEFCPHRGASLALGRNEDCGVVCIYHGWKIATDGLIVDTPTEPPQSKIAGRIRHGSYPVVEAGGVVWTYLGPVEHRPPAPRFEWTRIPEKRRVVSMIHEECNWAQAVEGALDAHHASVLHGGELLVPPEERRRDMAPRIEVQNTDYGFRFGAIHTPTEAQSAQPDDGWYVRVFAFAFPFHVFVPKASDNGSMHIFIPEDDYNTMWLGVGFVREDAEDFDPGQRRERRGSVVGVDVDDDYRKLVRNRASNYGQDREAMRRGESFSGIIGVGIEDMACQESMGPIYDRSREHLGVGDIGTIRFRNLMLRAARQLQEGEPAPGTASSVPIDRIRAEEKLVPHSEPWQGVGAFAGEPVPSPAE